MTFPTCQQCIQVRQQVCILPASEDCCRKIEKKVKSLAAPSASSRGKRQQVEVQIELPPKKKVKLMEEEVNKDVGEMTEGRFGATVVRILDRMEMRLRQQAAEVSHHARAAELTNILLQRMATMFGHAGHGTMSVEGNWETENEAEGSEYETEDVEEVEVETGLEEESGQLGEEEEEK